MKCIFRTREWYHIELDNSYACLCVCMCFIVSGYIPGGRGPLAVNGICYVFTYCFESVPYVWLLLSTRSSVQTPQSCIFKFYLTIILIFYNCIYESLITSEKCGRSCDFYRLKSSLLITT